MWGYMGPWWVSQYNFGVGCHLLSCLSGTFSASFWHFLTLKATHVRKNQWLSNKLLQLLRPDILYRLVSQLTPLDFYFLRYGPLTGTRWCSYGGNIGKLFFCCYLGKSILKKTVPTKKWGSTLNNRAIDLQQ